MVDRRSDELYYGWIIVGACFIGGFVVFGVSYSFGVFFEPLVEEFGLSRGAISLVFSIQTLVIYTGAALLGGFADRYGVQRFLGVGVGLFAVGLVWTSRATSLAALVFAYGVVTALGMGIIYVAAYATIPRWFGRRRGLASGVSTAGLGIGMVAVAPVAVFLIDLYGWRNAYLALVTVLVAALVVATAVIDDSPRSRGVDATTEFPDGHPDTKRLDSPDTRSDESLAATRDRANEEAEATSNEDRTDENRTDENRTDEVGADGGHKKSARVQASEVWAVATSSTFVLVFVGWVLIYGTLYVAFVHLVAHVTDVGMAERTGALALSAIGGTTAVARLVIGFTADRFGRIRTFVWCSVVMAGATVALPVVSTPIGLFAFAVVFGAGYGGNGALLSPLTADLFGMENVNAVFGLVSVSFAISGLLAPPLAGFGHDYLGTYTPSFVVAGGLGFVGAGLVWMAGRRERVLTADRGENTRSR